MIEKPAETPVPKKKNPEGKRGQGKRVNRTANSSPEPIAVDRPGFDLGGSTGKSSAGTGLGIGVDAAESRSDRRLPRGGRTSK